MNSCSYKLLPFHCWSTQQQHQQQQQQQLMNSYIPKAPKKKKREWYDLDLLTYFGDLKYKEFNENRLSLCKCKKLSPLTLSNMSVGEVNLTTQGNITRQLKTRILKITKMTFEVRYVIRYQIWVSSSENTCTTGGSFVSLGRGRKLYIKPGCLGIGKKHTIEDFKSLKC